MTELLVTAFEQAERKGAIKKEHFHRLMVMVALHAMGPAETGRYDQDRRDEVIEGLVQPNHEAFLEAIFAK